MATLPWVRMDTDWYTHPKFVQLIAAKQWAAISLYWAGVCWSAAHGQNGGIPAYVLPILNGSKALARTLVEVGLWDDDPDGWRIHNFADYQQDSAAAGLKQQLRSEHAKTAARARWGMNGSRPG